MLKPLMTAALLAAVPLVEAQVRVIDSEPEPRGQQRQESGNSGASGNFQSELFFQLQTLQEEVQQLRGMVEEQAHELQRLKQKQMDDYLDLDERIGDLSQGGGAMTIDPARGPNPGNRGGARAGGSDDERVSETQKYRDAYQLLRDREIDQAIEAFNGYLEEYPRGNFAGNSHYWLGEIYLLKEDLDEAQKWFEHLLEDFPDDRKRADAQYKLGRVYHQQGEEQKARRLLEDIASGTSDAARLARQYLEQNF